MMGWLRKKMILDGAVQIEKMIALGKIKSLNGTRKTDNTNKIESN